MKMMHKRLHRAAWAGLLAMALTAGNAAAATEHAGLKEVKAFAGSGQYGEADGAVLDASFRSPKGIRLLPDGTLLIADTGSHLIRSAKNGRVSTLAGVTFDFDVMGNPVGGLLDGPAATSVFQSPSGIDADAQGNVYVADTDNNVIRKIDPDGRVTTLAGSSLGVLGLADGTGANARFYAPSALVATSDGTLYVADTLNHAIRKVTPSGMVTTLNAQSLRAVEVFDGVVEPAGDFRDGKLSEALFNEPSGLALDGKGNLYVSDSGNQRIRYIDFAAGTVTTVAGGGDAGKNEFYVPGDYADGDALEARFDFPKGLAVTPDGGLLIADSGNHAIRLLKGGKVTTVVGNGSAEPGIADGTEKSARLTLPTDVEIDGRGNIYVADAFNNLIRIISDYPLPSGLVQGGSVQVAVFGSLVNFDAEPVIRNGRTLVPVRAIAEKLGYEVQFEDNRRVVLTRDNVRVTFNVGDVRVEKSIGSVTVASELDVPAFIENGRTYVPLRFIAETLQRQVDWLPQYRAAIIR